MRKVRGVRLRKGREVDVWVSVVKRDGKGERGVEKRRGEGKWEEDVVYACNILFYVPIHIEYIFAWFWR